MPKPFHKADKLTELIIAFFFLKSKIALSDIKIFWAI